MNKNEKQKCIWNVSESYEHDPNERNMVCVRRYQADPYSELKFSCKSNLKQTMARQTQM